MKDVDISEIDEDGVSWLASYQYRPARALSFEADLEVFRKGFAGATENVYAPQAYLLIGSGLYAGVGTGIYYVDDDFADRPFYAGKRYAALFYAANVVATVPGKAALVGKEDKTPLEIPTAAFATV